jgi:hypothetical protein
MTWKIYRCEQARRGAFENEKKINPAKSKAVCLTKARLTESLNSSLEYIVIPKANSCKYLGIILRSDFKLG